MRTLWIVGAMVMAASASAKTNADLVLTNGNMVTLDPSKPKAEAIAIAGGEIVLVGSNDEGKALIGPKTAVPNLQPATGVPRLVDAHAPVHDLREGFGELEFTR